MASFRSPRIAAPRNRRVNKASLRRGRTREHLRPVNWKAGLIAPRATANERGGHPLFFVPGQRLRSLSLSTPHASTLISILSRQPFLFCTLCSSTSGREESSRSFADRCLLLTPSSLPHRTRYERISAYDGKRERNGGNRRRRVFRRGNERTNERAISEPCGAHDFTGNAMRQSQLGRDN